MQGRFGGERFGDLFAISTGEWETVQAAMKHAYQMPHTFEQFLVFLGLPVRYDPLPRAMQNLMNTCQAYHAFGAQWRAEIFPRQQQVSQMLLAFAARVPGEYAALEGLCARYQAEPNGPLRLEFLALVSRLHDQIADLAAQVARLSDEVSNFSDRLDVSVSSNAEDDPELQVEIAARHLQPHFQSPFGTAIHIVDQLHAAVGHAAAVINHMQGAAQGLTSDFAYLKELLQDEVAQAPPELVDLSLEEVALSWARVEDEVRDFLGHISGLMEGWDHILPNGEYQIRVDHSGQVLDVEGESTQNGAHVIQFPWHGHANQRWWFEALDDGCYRIVSVHSGKVMDIEGYSREACARVHQWEWHGGDNQRFRLIRSAAGWYVIQGKQSGLVLDITGASTAPVTPLIQYPLHAHGNQRFWLHHL